MRQQTEANGVKGPSGSRRKTTGSSPTVTKPAAAKRLAQPNPKEKRARRKAAETLPAGFSVDKVRRIGEAKSKEFQRVRKLRNEKFRAVFDVIYDQFLYLNDHQDEQDRFVADCIGKNMKIRANADLSTILVRFYLNPPQQVTTEYAHALRGAALQGVRAGEMGKTLLKKGNSVSDLARDFAARHKKVKQGPKP